MRDIDRIYRRIAWIWFSLLMIGLNTNLHFISSPLLVFVLIFFFIIDWLLPRGGVVLQLLFSFVLVHRIYYIGSFFSREWLEWLWDEISPDIVEIWNIGFTEVSSVTAALLALLVTVAVSRIYISLVGRGRGGLLLLFVGTTMLTAVDIWAGSNITSIIVIYVVIGLVVMGSRRVKFSVTFPFRRWMTFLLVCVLGLTSIAWVLPDGRWDYGEWLERALDFPVFRTASEGTGGWISYTDFTGPLGGPMELDETPIFRVTAGEPVYLVGETLHHYTGTSWRALPKTYGSETFYLPTISGQEETITVEVLSGRATTVFTPRYPVNIDMGPDNEARLLLTPNAWTSQELYYGDYLFSPRWPVEPEEQYQVEAILPADDADMLRQLTNNGEPAGPFAYYRDIPDTVPQRVRDLAESVTAEEETGYDKAMALVDFLRNQGGWTYSLNTAVTPADEDFVDYFLFEQDRGYCVHFSTAFVIMARAVDLPARWVRGYSPGIREGRRNYIIQNNHAHAWGEIWFDEYGWVPFEPTPGNSLPRVRLPEDFDDEDDETDRWEYDDDYDELDEQPEPNHEPDVFPPNQGGGGIMGRSWSLPWIMLAVAVIAGALFALTKVRLRQVSITKLYQRLQRRFRFFGWQRQRWETPREHLERVQDIPHRGLWSDFVHSLEAAVYGDGQAMASNIHHRTERKLSLWKLIWQRFIVGR